MLSSRFYGKPIKRKEHLPWRLRNAARERIRGAIRGAAHRERLLHASPAKAMQRRIRLRLLSAYHRRFGSDDFYVAMSFAKEECRTQVNFWLPGGYAYWKERLLGMEPRRPFTRVIRLHESAREA